MSLPCCFRLGLVCRKRICFVLTAVYFILAGMEYSIILPTIWLFLTERFESETYMVGLVTTAYYISGFVSSPIMGSVYDRFRDKMKFIMIFAAICELTGSIMYFISFSAWFLVCARLVAGCGTGTYSVFYAMVARVTIPTERTRTISIFVGCRQLGMFLGPCFNVIFMNWETELWNYTIDSYTLPGILMAFLWALWFLFVFVLYEDFNQKDVDTLICMAEKAHQQNDKLEVTHSNNIKHGNVAEHNKAFELEICCDQDEQIGKETAEDFADAKSNSDGAVGVECVGGVGDGGDGDGGDGDGGEVGFISTEHDCAHFSADVNCTNIKAATLDEDDVRSDKKQIKSQTLEDCADVGCTTAASGDSDVRFTDDSYVKFSDDEGCPTDKSDCDEEDLKKRLLIKRVLSKLYNDYCYDDIVAVMFLSFVTFFNQLSLETMLAPLSYQVLGWREVNTSFLFIGIAVEIIVSFLILMKLSAVFSDRALLRAALMIEIVACFAAMLFVPNTPEKSSLNLSWSLPIIALQVFGTPFLLTCSRSLLSKITPEETQGLTQGLLILAENLACIFGPLWAGGAFHIPWIMFAVMVVMYCISLAMMIISYKKLNPKEMQIVQKIEKPVKKSE